MRIQGKSCTLTVAKDGYYYPLPYSEETVRQTSKGYALPGVIGERNREKTIITGTTIRGCFVTRLEYQNVLALFLLLFYYEEVFDLFADRICEQLIYKNLTVKSFELRGENGKALYLRIDVKDTSDSFIDSWPVNIPDLSWGPSTGSGTAGIGTGTATARTYYYDGHCVVVDLQTLPLVYRFELGGNYTEKSKYEITLYFPLDTVFYPTLNKIEKLTILLDQKDGISLDLYELVPVGSMTDINCADTVLCFQKFIIESSVILNIRNQNENKTVVL